VTYLQFANRAWKKSKTVKERENAISAWDEAAAIGNDDREPASNLFMRLFMSSPFSKLEENLTAGSFSSLELLAFFQFKCRRRRTSGPFLAVLHNSHTSCHTIVPKSLHAVGQAYAQKSSQIAESYLTVKFAKRLTQYIQQWDVADIQKLILDCVTPKMILLKVNWQKYVANQQIKNGI